MKKLIVISLALAMTFSLSGVANAVVPIGVGTGLTAGEAGGLRPIVKVKWEMKGPCFDGEDYIDCDGVSAIDPDDEVVFGEGLDDEMDESSAQFFAPGIWGADMHYTVCAIVTDPNGIGDVDGVYADISYPVDTPMHTSPSDPEDPDYNPDEIDDPSGGCGAFIEENTLKELDKDDGIDLFCNWIRTRNNDLPEFNDVYFDGFADEEEMYEEICNPETGELPEEEAYVYCDDKFLIWEDPAGDYQVEVTGHDSGGPGDELYNEFEYVEYTGFEVDFNSVNYENVIKDVRSQVSGDRDFDDPASDAPTVRNLGNTRLNMQVAQDDMDFGQKDVDDWNVSYDARVGNNAGDWSDYYDPFKFVDDPDDPESEDYTELYEILDLSETEKMDFVILVNKWSKGTEHTYAGSMWLDAEMTGFEDCE